MILVFSAAAREDVIPLLCQKACMWILHHQHVQHWSSWQECDWWSQQTSTWVAAIFEFQEGFQDSSCAKLLSKLKAIEFLKKPWITHSFTIVQSALPFVNKEVESGLGFENQIWNIKNALIMMIASLPIIAKMHHGEQCGKGRDWKTYITTIVWIGKLCDVKWVKKLSSVEKK